MSDLNPWQTVTTGSMSRTSAAGPGLADVLERVLDKGMVIAGDIKINLLDIELLTIKLRLLVTSVDKAKEMGIDWWEHDPALSSRARRELDGENERLRQRIIELEDSTATETGDQPMSGLNRGAAYTYAVARPFDPARIADLHGVDGAPVRLIGYDNVVAVVSTAAPGELDEASLSTRLERLDELEMLARSHDAVVASVCAHAVTLPFRLAIIHRGDAGVVDMLRREYGHLVAKLDRLSGHVELGVKVYIDSASPSPRHASRTSAAVRRTPPPAADICSFAKSNDARATRPGGCRLLPPHTPTPS